VRCASGLKKSRCEAALIMHHMRCMRSQRGHVDDQRLCKRRLQRISDSSKPHAKSCQSVDGRYKVSPGCAIRSQTVDLSMNRCGRDYAARGAGGVRLLPFQSAGRGGAAGTSCCCRSSCGKRRCCAQAMLPAQHAAASRCVLCHPCRPHQPPHAIPLPLREQLQPRAQHPPNAPSLLSQQQPFSGRRWWGETR
jgi:hypothetical protein